MVILDLDQTISHDDIVDLEDILQEETNKDFGKLGIIEKEHLFTGPSDRNTFETNLINQLHNIIYF